MRRTIGTARTAGALAALALAMLTAGCSRQQDKAADAGAAAIEPHAASVEAAAAAAEPISAREESPVVEIAPPATEPAIDPAVPERSAPPVAETSTAESRKAEPQKNVSRDWWDDLPLARMGEPESRTALASAPGYVPPADPEADAVRTGRRHVGPIEDRFDGGEPSPDDLANAILDALRHDDRSSLERLLVTEEEFAAILWPEFPQSRPITNLRAGDAHEMLARSSAAGISAGLASFGGQDILLDSVRVRAGRAPYTNFLILRDVEIVGRTIDGEPRLLVFAQDFVCRDGMWKVYAYKD